MRFYLYDDGEWEHRKRLMTDLGTEFWRAVFVSLIKELESTKDVKYYWEYKMPLQNLVPIAGPEVSNDRFGVIEDRQWVEWRLVSVVSIRKHWDTLLQACDQSVLDPFCKRVLEFLPGKKMSCNCCSWTLLPETAMYKIHQCIGCHDSQHERTEIAMF